MRATPETVRVVSEVGPNGFVIMNLSDFDPETMQVYTGEVPVIEEQAPDGPDEVTIPTSEGGSRPARRPRS